jgi:uncharacterized protein (DUF58 family)
MKSKRNRFIGAAILGLFLMGVAAPSALPKTTATLTASVVNQQCIGGDNVDVTLTATLQPRKRGVMFQWDFNNDGIFDTALSTNPTVTTSYPDEVQVTARVRASKGSRSAEATVTFQTLRCR